ncbi:MAG: glycosyltransferase family 9 protein [bacterium]
MKKILISRTDGIGDLVLATPVIKEIKNALKCHIALLVSEYSKEVLLNNPDVDEVITFNRQNVSGTIKQIKEAKFDAAITLFPEFLAAYVPFAAGVPLRYGTARRWYSPFFFNRPVNSSRAKSLKHEAEYNLLLAKEFIGEKTAVRTYWYLSQMEKEKAGEYLRTKPLGEKFIMVYPGGKSAANLSEKRYAAVVALLYKQTGRPVLLASGKGEQEKTKRIYDMIKKDVNIVLMNEVLTLRELSAVIGKAGLFVSCSTGPMHIAGALGVNTLSFFPATGVNPVRWRPLGNKSFILQPESVSAGMDSIRDEKIILKIQEV